MESQFHYGSIQIYSSTSKQDRNLGLNSTMVRFKLESSNAVRDIRIQRLNSTMVRFKSSILLKTFSKEKQSQFHYGSIQI